VDRNRLELFWFRIVQQASVTIDVDHSLRKGLWSFLRQIVTDAALDDPVRILA